MRKTDSINSIAILQPSYLPWLGFFEQMERCGKFVFLDDVQYTKNDWRNRNRIKTRQGVQWLTVPVTFRFGQKINEIVLSNTEKWQKKHLQALRTSYGKSPFFHQYFPEIERIILKDHSKLIDLTIELVLWIADILGLQSSTHFSSELAIQNNDRQERLIEICKKMDCDTFYEGSSGKDYIDIYLFKKHGITVIFQEYHHPYYNQLWLQENGFISHLSIIDLMFNHGPDSLDILAGRKVISSPGVVPVIHANDAGH